MTQIRTLLIPLALGISFLANVSVAEDKIQLPSHLSSVPLPDDLQLEAPSPSAPEGYNAFLGVWGGVPESKKRPIVLVVKSVQKNGTAKVIYALGESTKFEPFFVEKTGRFDGAERLVVSRISLGSYAVFEVDGDVMTMSWQRASNTNDTTLKRLVPFTGTGLVVAPIN